MSRPLKTGLEYFPLDVDMDQDDAIFMIEAEHGERGFNTVIKLLMTIYNEGYFKKWGEEEALIFAGKKKIPIDDVRKIVNTAVKRGFFDKKVYENYQILTSSGIQKRYIKACEGRIRIVIEEKYLLVDPEDFNTKIRAKLVIKSDIIEDKPDKTDEIPEFIPQSKAKQSKVKESSSNDRNKTPNKNKDGPVDAAAALSLSDFKNHLAAFPGFNFVFDDRIIERLLFRMQAEDCADLDFVDYVLERMVSQHKKQRIKSPSGFFLKVVIEWDDWIQSWRQVKEKRAGKREKEARKNEPLPPCPVCGQILSRDHRLDPGEVICRECSQIYLQDAEGKLTPGEMIRAGPIEEKAPVKTNRG